MSAPINRSDLDEWQQAQEPDYDPADDYDYDEDGYGQGWNDGYAFALENASPLYYWTIRQQSRLRMFRNAVRWQWRKLKYRLKLTDQNDIPF